MRKLARKQISMKQIISFFSLLLPYDNPVQYVNTYQHFLLVAAAASLLLPFLISEVIWIAIAILFATQSSFFPCKVCVCADLCFVFF